MIFEKDLEKKQLHVVREFNASIERVWRAWTEAELLDKWWGPIPWNAETKILEFKVGGQWLYSMVGPEGQKHWSKVVFDAVDTYHFKYTCWFSDEDGNPAPGYSAGSWDVTMKQAGEKTIVDVYLTYENIEAMERLIAMGFQGGFTIGLNQLEELFTTNQL